jgi:hypothetical protein
MNKNYQDLANAIILKAVNDYRSALLSKRQNRINEIELFFRSDYFQNLTNVEPEMIIEKLKKEMEKKYEFRKARRSRIYTTNT